MNVAPLKILSASAGSGKTFALTTHYLSLCLLHAHGYKAILALTFTNKATAEMKSRILTILKSLALNKMEGGNLAYVTQIQQNFPDWTQEEIHERAKVSFKYIIHDLSRFHVQTIDGFLQQVIRSFTYELDLDSGYRIELNQGKVKNDLTQRLFDSLSENEDLKKWTLDQMLNHIDSDENWDIERELIKLSNLIFSESFRDFDEEVSRPSNQNIFKELWKNADEYILAFENYYKESLVKIKDSYKDIAFSAPDFYRGSNSILFKCLNSDLVNYDLPSIKKVLAGYLGDIEKYQTSKKRLPHIEDLYFRVNPQFEALNQFIEEREINYQLALVLKNKTRYLRLVKKMSDLLADWRIDERSQLISDAQLLLEKIGLTSDGELTFLWEKLGNRFQYFLFDEFQDTSKGQWKSLFPLLVNALGQGIQYEHPHHLIVGDVKQSIYRFRNGDFRILLQGVEKDVKEAFHIEQTVEFIKKESLQFNFRSDKNIVKFNNFLYSVIPGLLQNHVNQVAQLDFNEEKRDAFWNKNGYDDIFLRAYAEQFQKLPEEKENRDSGEVKIFAIPSQKQVVATKSKGSPESEESIDESPLLLQAYQTLKSWLLEDKLRPGKIAVLVDTKDHAKLIYDFVMQRQLEEGLHIPISSGDGLVLESHEAIKCLIHVLKCIAYPGKSYSIYYAYAVFHYHAYKNIPLEADNWMSLAKNQEERAFSGLPQKVIQDWPQYSRLPLGVLIERLIADLEFDQDPLLLPYLIALRDFIESFSSFGYVGVPRFIKFWADEKDNLVLPEQTESHSIQILTIHKSKGLEYDAVLLPFLKWSITPNSKTQVWMSLENTPFSHFGKLPFTFAEVNKINNPTYILEESLLHILDKLNLLYVATTRAVKKLTIFIEEGDTDLAKEKGLSISNFLYKSICENEYACIPTEQEPYLVYHLTGSENEIQNKNFEGSGKDIYLKNYPFGEVLKDMIKVNTSSALDTDKDWHLSLEGRRFGNILHDIMSVSGTEKEALDHLSKQVVQGRIPENKSYWLQKLLRQIWSHPVLGDFLNFPHPQINEMGIVSPEGKTVRPDKIIVLENRTLVIDFKISDTNRRDEYAHQLLSYMDFLKSMGYPQVEGYIYYFIQNEVQSIH